jgi:hypothetical protein
MGSINRTNVILEMRQEPSFLKPVMHDFKLRVFRFYDKSSQECDSIYYLIQFSTNSLSRMAKHIFHSVI